MARRTARGVAAQLRFLVLLKLYQRLGRAMQRPLPHDSSLELALRKWRSALTARTAALRLALTNRGLAYLAASWGTWVAGEWATLVCLSVVAYADGGVQAVGILGALRVLPAVIVAPWTAALADRYPQPRLLAAIHFAWMIQLLAIALAASLHLSLLVVYGLVVVGAAISASFRPAVSALMTRLVARPEELAAANAIFGTMEATGTLLGPIATGALLAVLRPEFVFLLIAVLYAVGGRLSWEIRTSFRQAREVTARTEHRLSQLVAGFGALTTELRVRVIFTLIVGQAIMRGLLNVFILSAALALLGLGESGAGALFSAIGLGGLAGAVLSLALTGDRGLVLAFTSGVGAWGLAVMAIAASPNPIGALIFLAGLGVGNAVEDVAGLTLLQRAIPVHRLGRAFGALWGTYGAAVALGSLLAPVLITALGLRGAMAISGATLGLLVLAGWARLRGSDASNIPDAQLELLVRQPILAALPPLVIEQLARELQTQDVHAGDEVVQQGARGDNFYLIERGDFEVSVDGRLVHQLGPGDAFGETALLRQVERTATVSALSDGRLFWLDGRVFVPAVTGNWGSWEAASAVVDEHLARARPSSMR